MYPQDIPSILAVAVPFLVWAFGWAYSRFWRSR